MRRILDVEVLWCDGCPSIERAVEELRAALAEAGLGATPVRLREITTDAEARAERFVGSPTIRIDGVDVVPASVQESAALTCRVYRRRDGRFSPTPDPLDLRGVLLDLIARERVSAGARAR